MCGGQSQTGSAGFGGEVWVKNIGQILVFNSGPLIFKLYLYIVPRGQCR